MFGSCVGGRGDRCRVGERVELRVELLDALDVGGEPVVVERSMVREGEGGAAEVGEREVQRVLEFSVSVVVSLFVGSVDVAAERFEVEDLRVLAGAFAQLAVELIKRDEGLRAG